MKFFDKRRTFFGARVIATGHKIKGCLSALKKGQLLALLGDRDFSKQGIEMTLLGRRAFLPRGAAYFALKTNACIIPAFLVRKDKYYYHLKFHEPIFIDSDTSKSEEDVLAKYIEVLEKYIRQYPDQWYLFEKYWIDDAKNRS